MKKFSVLSFGLIAVLTVGCADRKNLSPMPTISEKSRAALDRPVNCSTAQRDINILESERASVGKQLLSGVRTIMPISAAAGILMGDYRDRAAVATGVYNNDLDAKIAQIKKSCRL